MPNQIITTSATIGVAYNLGSDGGSVCLIASGVRIVASTGAIYGYGNSQSMLVEGRIECYSDINAIQSYGNSSVIAIGDAAAVSIVSRDWSAAVYTSGDSTVIDNAGIVRGGSGIYCNSISATIDNSGQILATGRGSLFFGEPAAAIRLSYIGVGVIDITNTGLIKGSLNTALPAPNNLRIAIHDTNSDAGNIVNIDNSARIVGAILLSNGVGTVLNSGRITGKLDMGGGNDSVVNTGTLLRDVMLGDGNDVLRGANGNVQGNIYGGNGNDLITSGLGDDVLFGGNGDDLLRGGAGDDVIYDGDGADVLRGGDGDDTLVAGTGKDLLLGGSGADDFLFQTTAGAGVGSGRDLIRDFRPGDDTIVLNKIDANTALAGDQGFTFIQGGAFTRVAGQLRYSGGTLAGDINGDGAADFQIQIFGAPALTERDIVL
ncbi:calcium-binding protein [Gemmobacter caeruleus]|uniref:calcium-binding protein n=1 Tax=Gemmobacter caeruleus TaxID=2595004 RepID=UPI0011ECDD76|nr:hypothetical protein [Gemmobacter caeruleus]